MSARECRHGERSLAWINAWVRFFLATCLWHALKWVGQSTFTAGRWPENFRLGIDVWDKDGEIVIQVVPPSDPGASA